MKTETEWNQDILKITMKIHQEFPELSKYIEEMPEEFGDKVTEDENLKALKEYYDSLRDLGGEYSKTHTSMKKDNGKSKAS